ncbi:secretory calcium-binding phosphoprotein 5 [Xenentodon cancila]
MKLAILCLCLASTACAVPFQYLPHFAGPRPQAPLTQVKNSLTAGFPPIGVAGAYSVEIFYPHGFFGGATGGNQGQSLGFIKYSIPQPPGRQSLEVMYPYDFAQQRILQHIPPMTNRPVVQEVLPFEYPPQNPQQTMNRPSFDANAIPSQNPLQPLQQDQPTQTSKVPSKI